MIELHKTRIIMMALALVCLIAPQAMATITMNIDRDLLDFRVMEAGQTLEISDQGTYHNEVTCTSTNNKTWYLKAQLVRPFTSGMSTIPSDNFKWMVVDVVNGRGIVMNNVNVASPFSTFPTLIYTSDPVDNTGAEIKLRFRYELSVPQNQIAGNYIAALRFTMTELL